jgi:hypothetical protein
MTLSITGTGTSFSYISGSKLNPFRNASVLDTTQGAAITVTITVTDINGGTATDADGKFTTGGPLAQLAPGVYTISSKNFSSSPTGITTYLKGLSFTSATTAGTVLFKLNAADNLGQNAADSQSSIVSVLAPTNFTVADQTTGLTRVANGTPYTGPVAGLKTQYVAQSDSAAISVDNLNIVAITPNTFIHTAGGTDAIDVSTVGGKNVLDGGTGSNFLVGGKLGSGSDTFFVDDRNTAADVFSTVVNFHAGDDATIFGVNQTNFTFHVLDNQGAAGSTGVDFAFSAPGHANANFVLAGYSNADITSGRLSISFGTTPDLPGLPGSQYLQIHGT